MTVVFRSAQSSPVLATNYLADMIRPDGDRTNRGTSLMGPGSREVILKDEEQPTPPRNRAGGEGL